MIIYFNEIYEFYKKIKILKKLLTLYEDQKIKF